MHDHHLGSAMKLTAARSINYEQKKLLFRFLFSRVKCVSLFLLPGTSTMFAAWNPYFYYGQTVH